MLSHESIDSFRERLEGEMVWLKAWLEKQSCLPPRQELEPGEYFNLSALNLQNCRAAIQTISDIRAALLRIQQGKFGICIDCDQEIQEERLAVIPYASRCRPCQGKKGVRIH